MALLLGCMHQEWNLFVYSKEEACGLHIVQLLVFVIQFIILTTRF